MWKNKTLITETPCARQIVPDDNLRWALNQVFEKDTLETALSHRQNVMVYE